MGKMAAATLGAGALLLVVLALLSFEQA